jgi:hypothetical protein
MGPNLHCISNCLRIQYQRLFARLNARLGVDYCFLDCLQKLNVRERICLILSIEHQKELYNTVLRIVNKKARLTSCFVNSTFSVIKQSQQILPTLHTS